MLRAKYKSRYSKGKQDALKDISKEDDMRGMFVRLPASMMVKLHVELAKRDMTMVDWMKEKIAEL